MAPLRPAPHAALLLLVLLVAGLGASQAAPPAPDGLPAGADRLLRDGRPVLLTLDGVPHRLSATPHTLLAADAQVATLRDGAPQATVTATPTTYRGETAGTSLGVRLSIDPARPGVEGLILRDDGTGWLLLPRADGGADLVPTLGLRRAAIDPHDHLDAPVDAAPQSATRSADGTLRLRLAVEVNFLYWYARQGDWQDRILELVSYTELLYEKQLDVVFEVTYLAAWETQDPYTSTHACWGATTPPSEGRLEQFATYWQANRQGVTRDAAHLFVSGFSRGSFTGCAYIEALGSYAYGVSKAKINVYGSREAALWDNINLFAHELGHNFGGLHEMSAGLYGVTGIPLTYGIPPHTIMDTGVNSVLRFSDLDGFVSPRTGYELDNAGKMRAHAEDRLGAA